MDKKKILLRVDEETCGSNKEVACLDDLKRNLDHILDERTYEVVIKKRAVINSPLEGTTTNSSSNNLGRR